MVALRAPVPATKVCRGCGEQLPLEAFDRDNSLRDGRKARCPTCRNARVKAWRHRTGRTLKPAVHRRREDGALLCGLCHEHKPPPAFAKIPSQKGRARSYCRSCAAAEQRRFRALKAFHVVHPSDCDDAPALEYLVARARFVPRQHFDRTDTTWEAWLNWWDDRELFLDDQALRHISKVGPLVTVWPELAKRWDKARGQKVPCLGDDPRRVNGPMPPPWVWVFEHRVREWQMTVAAVEARGGA